MDPLYLDILKEFNVTSPEEAKLAAEKALHEAVCAYQKADEALHKAQVAMRKAYTNCYLAQELAK